MFQEVVNLLVVRYVLLVPREDLVLFNIIFGKQFKNIVWVLLIVVSLLDHGVGVVLILLVP